MLDSHDKSFQGSLPHIATMGRDETLQQMRFKTLKRNHPKKRFSPLK
ncbi:hypothetical protein KVJ66_00135 [Helicobacter pylori]|nr:hypothetical protein KVJ66_00135 [Helicobacter pylori]